MNQTGRKHIDFTSSPIREQLETAEPGIEPDTLRLRLPSPFFTPFAVTPLLFLSVTYLRTTLDYKLYLVSYRVEALDLTPLGFNVGITLSKPFKNMIEAMEISWLALDA